MRLLRVVFRLDWIVPGVLTAGIGIGMYFFVRDLVLQAQIDRAHPWTCPAGYRAVPDLTVQGRPICALWVPAERIVIQPEKSQ